MTERLGKFSSDRDAMLYELCLGEWANRSTETSDGYLWAISNSQHEAADLQDAFSEAFQHEGVDVAQVLGSFMLRQRLDGIVEVQQFDTAEELEAEFFRCEQQWAESQGNDN